MEEILRRLANQIDTKKYGKYRGFVEDNDDPTNRGRLRLKVPVVLGDAITDWALPCLPAGGLADQGFFAVPEIGAQLWIEFEEGDLNRPIWIGTFWQTQDDVPEEARLNPPTVRLLKTPSGHRIQLDDTDSEEQLIVHHKAGAELAIDKDGTVTLKDADGNQLVLDAKNKTVLVEDSNGNSVAMVSSGTTIEDRNGNKIDMAASGLTCTGTQIVLDGTVMAGGQGGEPVIKGSTFLTMYAAHVHPTGVGPSGPPIPMGEATSLATKVMAL